jgi:hypothetical protein
MRSTVSRCEVAAETSPRSLLRMGSPLAGRCLKGVPHRGRTVDTQHAERLVSRDETKKVQ